MSFKIAKPDIFYGWYLVAVCVVIILYTGGVANFGFTAVFSSIAAEFPWSYAQISLAASLRGFEMGLTAPLVGILVDRWGPRKLIFGGSIFMFLGFLTLSRITSLPMYYGAFLLIALGMSTTSGTVLLTAVTNWFRQRANLATGIVVSGFGMGGILIPIVTKLIDSYDWRTAMLIVAVGTLVIILPLSFLVRHRPEKYGTFPDGKPALDVSDTDTQPVPEINIPLKHALRNRAFWHVSLSSMCHSFIVGAVAVHVMPYLESLGVDRSLAAMVAMLLPVSSIVGRMGAPWFIGRFGERIIYTGAFSLLAAGLLLFGTVTGEMTWLLIPFVMTLSLGWGFSVTTRLALQRGFFGRASFGSILGFVSAIMMVGNVSGAPIAGLIFDNTGSYHAAWYSFAALAAVGAVIAATVPPFSSTAKLAERLAAASA